MSLNKSKFAIQVSHDNGLPAVTFRGHLCQKASSDTKCVKTVEQTVFQFDGNVAAVNYNEVKMYVVRSSEVKVVRRT